MIVLEQAGGREILEHHPEMERSRLYEVMGDVFSMKEWRQRMPYLHNRESYYWMLCRKKQALQAFLSFEISSQGLRIANEWAGDWNELTGLIDLLLERGERPMLAKAEGDLLKFYQERKFEEVSRRGKYRNLKRS